MNRMARRDMDDGAFIFVSGLRLMARVGVNPGERGAEQPVVLDIHVVPEDLEAPARSERLADTVDYVAIARTARKVVERRHYPLVETLAQEVARALLDLPGVLHVRVRLQKPRCLKRAEGAGVQVEIGRREPRRPQPISAREVRSPEALVVIGGGAAGLSSALWASRLGRPALLVEPAPRLGGQLRLVYGRMTDLPGMPAMDGEALIQRLEQQFQSHGGRWHRAALIGMRMTQDLVHLELQGPSDSSGSEAAPPQMLTAQAAILCTGSRRRQLGVPGEGELQGLGLLHTAARGAEEQRGRSVVVVGGGDAACENALILARAGAHVTLVHRGIRLTARSQFRSLVSDEPDIRVRLGCRVRRFIGQGRLNAVELGDGERIPAEAALVRIGWQPNTTALPPSLLDSRGFVRRTGPDGVQCRGQARLFVAGEITGSPSSSVATAFGSGAAAARAAVTFIEGQD